MGFPTNETSSEDLLKSVQKRLGQESYLLVKKAYELSEKAHQGQKRLSGEPYIIHPLSVASILNELGLDAESISAGLLHDVIEDTEYTRKDMIHEFGENIANLVEGVTKISKIKNQSKESEAVENIRKMLEATTKDVRVILIKLADKTHNMRTLKFQPPHKQKRIAQETLHIYAPMAGRLGIYKMKSELEDMSFQILLPDSYLEIKERVAAKKSERDQYIEKIKYILKQRLAEINLDAKIEGRAKHFYSIYRKMKEKEKNFEQIFDLRAVRIITKDTRDCYGVLGIVHTLWNPIPGRFKDYIATPKMNRYRSLHTSVIGSDGKALEVQIRTQEMNEVAEYGIAAHWAYKEGKTAADNANVADWLKRFDPTQDGKEFLEDLRLELHEDEVFVFTPKGKIIELPKGSTTIDFAFRIHTDIGLRAKGARINGRMVPLRTELKSGDQLEIITDKNTKPSPIWLRFVKTVSARQKLRQYFRKLQEDTGHEDSITIKTTPPKQKSIFPQEQKIKEKQNKDKDKKVSIVVAGTRGVMLKLAKCCSPLPGDEIVGFITKGKGVSVHKVQCDRINKTGVDYSRVIGVRWEGVHDPFPVQMEVKAEDRRGIYLEMVSCISRTDTNIVEATAQSAPNNTLIAKFTIEIEHLDQFYEIADNIKSISGVRLLERIKI